MLFNFIILGLLIGSFLNVLIIRMPKSQSVVFPSSHCVKCKKKLKFYHNIPVLSWLFLGGKCAYCKEKISLQYPLVELLSAGIFALCFLHEEVFFIALAHSLVFAFLLALSVIDLRYKAVPDNLSLPTLLLSCFSLTPFLALQNALLLAGGFSLLRIFVSYFLKREAMGEADIIIAAVMGALLGWKLAIVAVYLSAVFAMIAFILVRKKAYEMPFIPFLALGTFLSYVFDDFILEILASLYA